MRAQIDFKNKELIMADLEAKEVHEKRILDKKQRNLDRANVHYADRIQNHPGMPADKVQHRLTNHPLPTTPEKE